ncbi:hypothetical protein [uncultured Kordia sp.]|uniref:hypothetical protein n=1 Tax=uncultured Kordia sp. TaxID=507699 RepID=UPI00261DD161|nr:hypothetical protein [uncultured Kordia sp.]
MRKTNEKKQLELQKISIATLVKLDEITGGTDPTGGSFEFPSAAGCGTKTKPKTKCNQVPTDLCQND